MHTDDELRAQLIRERAGRGRSGRAGDLLTDLRPAMRRARRRRIAATTVAASVGLGGLAAAAQVVRTERADTIRISTDTAPLVEVPTPTDVEAADPERSTTIAADPALPGHDEGDFDGADPTATNHEIVDDDDHHVVAPSPTIGAGSQGSVGPGQSTASSTTLPEPSPATTATVTTIAARPAPSTAPTTAPAPERFECRCGYVIAIRSSNSVELIEIVPEPGYDYRLEDPDNGAITVQFTGTGEDCELKIPTAGGGTDDD